MVKQILKGLGVGTLTALAGIGISVVVDPNASFTNNAELIREHLFSAIIAGVVVGGLFIRTAFKETMGDNKLINEEA